MVLAPVLVFVLVTGFGVLALSPDRPPEPTFTQRAQQAAANRAGGLAADAAALSGSGPAAGAFAQAAQLLQAQASGLALPPDGSSGTGSRSPSPGPADPSAGAGSPEEAVTPEGFIEALGASARANLGDAPRADAGVARLLASVGSSQWQQAAALGALLGVPVEPPAGLNAPADTGLPAASECTGEPRGTEADRSMLLAAARAEARAVYAYEVAAARLPAPDAVLAGAREHAAVAEAATAALSGLCAPAPARPPVYALDPGFLADPAAGIARLEQELCVFYGSLGGSGGTGLRTWAVGQLNAAVQRSFAADGVAEPFPGIPVELQNLPSAPGSGPSSAPEHPDPEDTEQS